MSLEIFLISISYLKIISLRLNKKIRNLHLVFIDSKI
jgi:hypothetical protein